LVSRLRAQRIADRIREEISELIIYEVQDPRLAGISITDVQVDRELTFADVYISAMEGSQRAEEILAGLEHAGGFMRSQLASRVKLRTFPRLRFHWDHTLERADRIEQLLASLSDESSPDRLGETGLTAEQGEVDGQ